MAKGELCRVIADALSAVPRASGAAGAAMGVVVTQVGFTAVFGVAVAVAKAFIAWVYDVNTAGAEGFRTGGACWGVTGVEKEG